MKPTYSGPMIFIILCISVGITGCQSSNEEQSGTVTPDKISEAALAAAESVITPEGLLEHIALLASDDFGGRAPMTAGEDKTLAFLEEQFKGSGLEPLFPGSYHQEVPLVSIDVNPRTANLQLSGKTGIRRLIYSDEMVIWTTRVTEEIDVANSNLVFVGYGIVAPEYGWDDYADVDVTGKTVLLLINDPGYALGDPNLFNGTAMTYYGRWTYKYEEAVRQGAAGAIIIHETGAAAYPWQTVDNSWSGVQIHLENSVGNMDQLAFESWVQYEVAAELVSASGFELGDLEQRALSREFAAIELSWHVTVHIDNTVAKSVSYNLGGVIEGIGHPDEAFIYTAHWDHLGTIEQEFEGQDVIFNGASDNATGVAGLIGIARAFKALPKAPARSVVFLAVTAEESGLLGSKWYGNNPQIPMSRTVAGLNMDNLNVYGPTTDITLVGYGNSELDDIIRQQAALKNRTVTAEAEPEKGRFYRSDHFNFARHGVPMLYPKPGITHISHEADFMLRQNKSYTAQRYHTPEDEILENWDLTGLAADLHLYFRFGVKIAEGSTWPAWVDGNEFKAIRAASIQMERHN